MASEYKLSCELHGHSDDVRGVCAFGDSGIITGSRDKTVKLWTFGGNGHGGFSPPKTLSGHAHFVGPVAYAKPSPAWPSGAVISGSMDKSIIVWDVESAIPANILLGHEEVISDLAVTASGDILSASQDKTVRVWRNGQCQETLTGHTSAVQAVLAGPDDEIVSASSDCTIKVWNGSTCTQTVKGHTDTVRGLALMEGVGVVSASHDGSVRLWSQTGSQLLEMVGHTALVYCVAAHRMQIASGSEDNSARIWEDGMCLQVLDHPGCVWDLAFLPNGDLVTGCADGVVRVWTKDSAKVASQEVMETYEAQLASTRKSKTVGGIKLEDLPGVEALQQPGEKDGEHLFVCEGQTGVAYSWNKKEFKWDKLGEVVDGPTDPLESRSHQGEVYDYVFDVDIGDGVPARKLPYNRGQNPYDVASQWLLEQDLPQGYREQVVQFIIQNSGQTAGAMDAVGRDPYTGGQAYIPGQASGGPAASDNVDPFTGSGSRPRKPQLKHVPKKGFLLFESAPHEAILKKINDFNALLAAEETTKACALDASELACLEGVIKKLQTASTTSPPAITSEEIVLVDKMMTQWPSSNLFPVLDVLRLLVLHPQAAPSLTQGPGSKDVLLSALLRASCSPVLNPNLLTGVRTATNCFRHTGLRTWLREHRAEILDAFSTCSATTNRNIKLGWASLLLNYAVLLGEESDEEGQIQTLSAAYEIAPPQESDTDVQFQALVVIGTLMQVPKVKSIAVDLDVHSVIEAAKISKAANVVEVAKDLEQLL